MSRPAERTVLDIFRDGLSQGILVAIVSHLVTTKALVLAASFSVRKPAEISTGPCMPKDEFCGDLSMQPRGYP